MRTYISLPTIKSVWCKQGGTLVNPLYNSSWFPDTFIGDSSQLVTKHVSQSPNLDHIKAGPSLGRVTLILELKDIVFNFFAKMEKFLNILVACCLFFTAATSMSIEEDLSDGGDDFLLNILEEEAMTNEDIAGRAATIGHQTVAAGNQIQFRGQFLNISQNLCSNQRFCWTNLLYITFYLHKQPLDGLNAASKILCTALRHIHIIIYYIFQVFNLICCRN